MKHFTQTDLARRWSISPRTLENLRWRKKGPPYLKVGGRVLYRVEDIEAYEREHAFLTSNVRGAALLYSTRGA